MTVYSEVAQAAERLGDAIEHGVRGYRARGVLGAGQYTGLRSRISKTCPAREGEAFEIGRMGRQMEDDIVIYLGTIDDMQSLQVGEVPEYTLQNAFVELMDRL